MMKSFIVGVVTTGLVIYGLVSVLTGAKVPSTVAGALIIAGLVLIVLGAAGGLQGRRKG